MANITLAEIKMLIDNKVQELSDLYAKRSQSLIDTYRIEKGSTEEVKQNVDYEFSVDELTDKADKLENEILILKSALTKANCSTEIDFTLGDDNRKLTLQEGIIYIKSLRQSVGNIKYLGELKENRKLVDDQTFGNSLIKGYTEIKRPTFNTKKYRERYEKINKLIQKLEVQISSKNYTVKVEILDKIAE